VAIGRVEEVLVVSSVKRARPVRAIEHRIEEDHLIVRQGRRVVSSKACRRHAFAFVGCLPNDLPFSSERPGRLRAYHDYEAGPAVKSIFVWSVLPFRVRTVHVCVQAGGQCRSL